MKKIKGEVKLSDPDICTESDFVKNIRKTHCKGCMDEHFPGCGCQQVLDCWLRATYLPKGEWSRACMCDMMTANVKELTEHINNEILKDLEKLPKKK